MADFNRLTERAQAAVIGAQKIAQDHSAPEIDSEHLLLALLSDDEGVPAVVLRQIGINVASLVTRLQATIDARPKVYGRGEPRIGRELNDVLTRAGDEALTFKDDYVSTEHLLLAIADIRGKSDAAAALKSAGATKERLLQALASVRGSQRITDQNPE